tara:strand:+ start:48 stop:257 length:210 start_codon:yes stop_codon:yes gene_type:complete
MIKYYTLEELKDQILSRINDKDCCHNRITRAHENMFGTMVPRAIGEDAPEGKFKVMIPNERVLTFMEKE